jgi:hypothetical protein
MSHFTVAERPACMSAGVPWYSGDLLSKLQESLGELADIEFRYEQDWNRLQASAEPDEVKQRLTAELVRRYHSERKPCLERLARLQSR